MKDKLVTIDSLGNVYFAQKDSTPDDAESGARGLDCLTLTEVMTNVLLRKEFSEVMTAVHVEQAALEAGGDLRAEIRLLPARHEDDGAEVRPRLVVHVLISRQPAEVVH